MAEPVTADDLRQKAAPGAVDPNVKIPRHVVEAGQRSEAIQRAVNGTAEPSVAAQIAEPEQAPRAPQDPLRQGQAPQEPEPHRGPVDWERQFKSLNGRIEAENRRTREQLAQMSEQLERTQRENALLRGQAPVRSDPAQPVQPMLTEQEIADYGPDFVDVMRRVVAEATNPLINEVNNLRSGLGYVQQETGNAFLNRMNSSLSAMVPRWDDINKDPSFIQWSQLPDVFSGAIRKSLMQEAWNSGDANRVAAFFQAFLAEVAATNPQGSNGQARPMPRTVVENAPSPVQPAFDLASLAAPGRAQSSGTAPVDKPVYTAADISKFYTDVAAGRWRGRDQQRVAIDADIILAQHEGRIISDNRTQLPRDPYAR